MKKTLMTAVLAGTTAGSVALANNIPSSGTLTASLTPGYQYDNGGQFTVEVDNNPNWQFQTYCIEIQNEFSPGSTYSYTLGQSTHDYPPPNAVANLTLGAAFLFSQFATGQLAGETAVTGGYALPNNSTGAQTVGALQAALWYFEGQGNDDANFNQWNNGSPTGVSNGGATGDFYTDWVLSILGPSAYNPSNGKYGVDVVQVPNGQDWLIDPVPDGGMTASLLGGALVGLGVWRRKGSV